MWYNIYTHYVKKLAVYKEIEINEHDIHGLKIHFCN